jgi:hypothetical protein
MVSALVLTLHPYGKGKVCIFFNTFQNIHDHILYRNKYWKLELHFTNLASILSSPFKIFLHNQNDLPSAMHNQAYLNFYSYINGKRLVMKNIDSYKESTISNPCDKYWPKECHEVNRQKAIESQYRLVPF